jgi:cold shock CspA family protein/ribosome-associated translation inhibitor RaiA
MQIPLQIVAQGLELDERTEEVIRAHADKLETFFDRIMGCRVTVSVPNRWPQGNPLTHRVRIDLTVPRGELVVRRQPHPILLDAIQDAFRVAGRRLQDYARELPDGVSPQARARPARAQVVRLFPWEGYGFLRTPDGKELYFHRNSVLRGGFGRLEVGTEVRYAEEEGDHGPQASSVEIRRRRRTSPQR